MVNLIMGPAWFRGADIVIDIFCFIIAFIISLYGYRIYRIIKETKFLHFSLAFFFISGAFFTRILANLLIYFTYSPPSSTQALARQVIQHSAINSLGFFVHITLMLAAFMVLIALNMKLKDKKIISLLFIMSFISSFLGVYLHHVWFFIVSFILLIYITHYFYLNYTHQKSNTSKLVFISFALFTIAQLLFIIASGYPFAFVLAESVQLVSFALLLATFIAVLRQK